jgi:hypothetical protein
VNCKTIKEWEDLDAIVFETRAMKCLIKMIEEEDIVTVIGSMCVLRVSMFASFYVFLAIGILEQIQQCGIFFVFH